VARTVAVIGDRWTLLLLRDCFLGVRRFEDFQARLGISRTIITERLGALVDEGVLRREPYQERPVRHEYRLTPKGRALYPVLIGMVSWGNAYGGFEPNARLKLRHKGCGHTLKPVLACEACGEKVDAREVEALGAAAERRRP
jgi:DNA-binding HxlR family transcriptional regulator